MDIHGEETKKIEIRKMLNNEITSLAINEAFGYKRQTWYEVRIVMNDHKF